MELEVSMIDTEYYDSLTLFDGMTEEGGANMSRSSAIINQVAQIFENVWMLF